MPEATARAGAGLGRGRQQRQGGSRVQPGSGRAMAGSSPAPGGAAGRRCRMAMLPAQGGSQRQRKGGADGVLFTKFSALAVGLLRTKSFTVNI